MVVVGRCWQKSEVKEFDKVKGLEEKGLEEKPFEAAGVSWLQKLEQIEGTRVPKEPCRVAGGAAAGVGEEVGGCQMSGN